MRSINGLPRQAIPNSFVPVQSTTARRDPELTSASPQGSYESLSRARWKFLSELQDWPGMHFHSYLLVVATTKLDGYEVILPGREWLAFGGRNA